MVVVLYTYIGTVKPLEEDTLKEEKFPKNGQADSTLVYTLYAKSPLKEDNLPTKDKMLGPKCALYSEFPPYIIIREFQISVCSEQ